MSRTKTSTLALAQDSAGHQTRNNDHCFPQPGSLPARTAGMNAGRQFRRYHPWRESMYNLAEPPRFRPRDRDFSGNPFYDKFKTLHEIRSEPYRPSELFVLESLPKRGRSPESFDSLLDDSEGFKDNICGISRLHGPYKDSNGNQGCLADPTRAQSSTESGPASNTRPSLTRNPAQLLVPTCTNTGFESSESCRTVASNSATRTCVACSEDLPVGDFSESSLTENCSHSNSACRECVQQWIEARLSNGTWDDIKCLECDEMMQYFDVRQHANSEAFEKYDTLAARSCLNNEEDLVWCRNQGCGSGQLHVGGQDTPMFRCGSCKSQYCIVHEVPWHEGETCADFDRRMNGGQPVDNERPVDPAGPAHFRSQHRPGRQRCSMSMHSNNRHERRLYDEARIRRWMADDGELPPNENVAQSLEDDVNYAWGHTIDSADAWGRRNFSGYMPRPSEEWAPQVSAARAAMVPAPLQSTSDSTRFVSEFWDNRTRVYSNLPLSDQRGHPVPTTFPQSQMIARGMPVQLTGDDDYARQLQRQFNSDDDVYARQLQRQLDHEDEEGLMAPRGTRLQREQSSKDATTARALHDEFQREEQDRQEREAYRRRKTEEKEGEETVRTHAKQCPQCGWFIQKNNGCDHMTCWKCKHEFCYLCLADYQRIRDNGNSAHKSGCRDYRRA